MNRKDFELLKEYTYLDTGAAALKPQKVIDATIDFYQNYPVNPHSPDSPVGVKITQIVKETRALIAKLVDAKSDEVIFTSGSTDSLNRVALMLKAILKPNDEVLISPTNHSSAIVPFLEVALEKKAKVVVANENILEQINPNTKLVIVAQQSNVANLIPIDMPKIYAKAQKNQAFVINDAAQAIVHGKVTLKNADVLNFSSNKLYGPTGSGALIIKESLLKLLKPATFGGGAVSVIENDFSWKGKGGIGDFEAGTLNTAGIVGLKAAIEYFLDQDLPQLFAKEKKLALYAYDQLSKVKDITIYSQRGDTNLLFNIASHNAQDIVSFLGHKKIILRAGSHCAHLFPTMIKQKSSVRMSIGGYNIIEDIDKLILALKNGGDFIEFI